MSDSKNRSGRIIATLVIVLSAAGGVWAWSAHGSKADDGGVPSDLTKEKLVAASKENPGQMFDKMRDAMDRKDLTEEQKRQIGENMRAVRDALIQEHVDEYFAAKEKDRASILDKHIEEFEKFRKEQEERDARREAEDAAKDKDKPEEEKEKDRDKMREEMRKRYADRTQAQRKTDSETRNPNQMAQRMAYMSAMHKQMEARGIKPPQWGRGGGRGPGGPRH